MRFPSTHLSLLGGMDSDSEESRKAAWWKFSNDYRPCIVAFCRRLGIPEAAAEDIAQRTLLDVLEGLKSYDPEKGAFRPWLSAVIRNCWVTSQRKDDRIPGAHGRGGDEFHAEIEELASRENAADELASSMENYIPDKLQEVLSRARARVQENTWKAFEQTRIFQRSSRDVAADLGISQAAVCMAALNATRIVQEEYRKSFRDEEMLSGVPA